MIEAVGLVPELDFSDLAVSLMAYRDVFGFEILAELCEEAFAYLAIGRAHLMLQQAEGAGPRFRTTPLERPYGRSVNLQNLVPDVTTAHELVRRSRLSIIVPLEDHWYRHSKIERGNLQFVVADPDGYLLRFYQDLGYRSLT